MTSHNAPTPLTRAEVRRVDEVAIRDFGIPGVVLMENAGRNAADAIERAPECQGVQRVRILCGTGNNGGDGFVVARHLHLRGHDVTVHVVGSRDQIRGDADINATIVERMGLPLRPLDTSAQREQWASQVCDTDLLVDALLGTGAHGALREPILPLAALLETLSPRAVVALDLPTGLDCDSGTPAAHTVRADVTLTFVARKVGFDAVDAAAVLGRVEVLDIGAPWSLPSPR